MTDKQQAEKAHSRTPLRCRLLGHRWEDVRAWDTGPDRWGAWFCRRCDAPLIPPATGRLLPAREDPDFVMPEHVYPPADVCSECGQTGQCAACYLMESQGLTPPSANRNSPGEDY